jgi:hypothetical protein
MGAVTTITVGGVGADFADIQSAWNSLAGKVLTQHVTIKVADGVYNIAGLSFGNHPYAHLIRIKGNIAAPDSCQLVLTGTTTITFNNVQNVNISGFAVHGSFAAGTVQGGIFITSGAVVVSDANSMKVYNCTNGIYVSKGGLYSSHGVIITACENGVVASNNGSAFVDYLTSAGLWLSGQRGAGFGSGVISQINSMISANYANIRAHTIGIGAAHNGVVLAYAANASDCYYGFLSNFCAQILASYNPVNGNTLLATALNCEYGFNAQYSATLHCAGATATGCTIAGFASYFSASMYAPDSQAVTCAIGYTANRFSSILAQNTLAANTSTTAYDAPASDTPNALQGMITWN